MDSGENGRSGCEFYYPERLYKRRDAVYASYPPSLSHFTNLKRVIWSDGKIPP